MNKIIFASKEILVVTCLLGLTLSGCSDSDETTITEFDLVNDLVVQERSIVGIWDGSAIDPIDLNNTLDVFYVQITSDFIFREFDYEGDGLGSGENCYTEYGDGESITPIGGDVYEIYNGDTTFYLDPADDANNVLVVKDVGFEERRWPRIENISPLDINICE